MKKYIAGFLALCQLYALTACNGSLPTTPSEINISTSPVISPSLPTSTPGLILNNFDSKVLLGEDDNYSIYLINPVNNEDGSQTGELIVNDKSTNQVMKMNGTFSIFGSTIVSDDGNRKYILLSVGTYTSRSGIVLSLEQTKQAIKTLCMTSTSHGDHLFWNDFIIINNCDIFTNRPWGVGEAPSIIAINLKTGTETTIAKSDLTHQFEINKIDGNNLQYVETYVENQSDWQNTDKQKTQEKIFDLSLLAQ